MLSAFVKGFPVNLWFLRIRGKAVLNRYGNSSPPPKCPLKRGLVYHVCSRLNNMSVIGIRTTPSQLLLVQEGAPSLTPTLRFPSTLLRCRPSPPAPLWIMNDFPTVCHTSYFTWLTQGKQRASTASGEWKILSHIRSLSCTFSFVACNLV